MSKESLNSPTFSISNKFKRLLWWFIYLIFFKFSPVPFFTYRRFILSLLGADLGRNTMIYPSVKIWLPSNLAMKNGSTLGPRVNVYNQGKVSIGEDAIISQDATICASTHNYNDPVHPLILAPITVNHNAWVCAEAFIGPGVILAEGSVIGARAVITKDSKAWCVYAGNPAKEVNTRKEFR